jgi:acylphosphatase
MDVARHVIVRGRVQGVWFRESCRQQAIRANVRGWVKNAPDGSVEAWFEGPADAVDQVVNWCRQGPRRAEVTGVEIVAGQPLGLRGFEVR